MVYNTFLVAINSWTENVCPPHITSVQYCGGCSVHWRLFITSGDNISTVEGIRYSGGRFLISACLAIKNDEKISIFFCITKRNFYWEISKILPDFVPF